MGQVHHPTELATLHVHVHEPCN
ncbi:MAG: hypothetical protein QOD43_734, partial [Gaiellaceae bacterium]|nr:hypothetical protein [Gaiellaceae bacterium]